MSVNMMERKKSQQMEDASSKKVFDFFGDVKAEFKKISWTKKDELQVYTKIVIAATFLFGMLVYFMDVFIQQCLTAINAVAGLIIG
ncbi:MAG: preprotein translocase subunit SecE [Waddliaceae bacterium]